MSESHGTRSTRLVRWWVRRYTAGVSVPIAADRCAEIDSDLADHEACRREDDWSAARVTRERLRRTLLGVPADIGWRRDRLRGHVQHKSAASLVGWMTTAAQLVLAAYLVVFAAYLLGRTGLADQRVLGRSVLGGFDHYADSQAAPAALIIGALGLVLAAAAACRPISPIVSNAVSIPIAMLAAMFFWLGVWPLGLMVVVGAVIDLAARAQPPVAR